VNYREIIKNVLLNGTPKEATRLGPDGTPILVENSTIGTFCEVFRHDMSKGFPLTTLRKMPWRSIRVELEGFIKGVTDKKWYQDRKCGFWNEWSNPLSYIKQYTPVETANIIAVPLGGSKEAANQAVKSAKARCTDLGPIYGYQWRNFGEHYSDNYILRDMMDGKDINGLTDGTDQFYNVVNKLHNSPYDRRMVVSAWNPNQEHLMALPSCHVLWNVVVYGNKLNLVWFQRSVDSSHGLPANIASYGLLLLLLCEESGLEPGELVGVLSDCHLYNNTIESVKIMVQREEKQLPEVKIKRKADGSFSIFDWTYEDVETVGYDPHPPIDMGAVTV
jgi:thymidylate synthase